MAFAVARFIQKGGSLVNYYMVSDIDAPAMLLSISAPSSHFPEMQSCFYRFRLSDFMSSSMLLKHRHNCFCSTMEEPILAEPLEAPSLPQVTIMMLRLMNMVRVD